RGGQARRSSAQVYGLIRADSIFGTEREPRLPEPQMAWARIVFSAARTASGVPTCIQTPSRRSPQSRPASAAWSNNGEREKAPAGALAKKAGVRIAAPA